MEFLNTDEDTGKPIAFGLGLRCGSRCKELVEVTPRDVVAGPVGTFLRVEHGKAGKYRETPPSTDLATIITTLVDLRDEDDSTPLAKVLEYPFV